MKLRIKQQHGAQNQTYNDIKIGDIVQTKILQVKNLGLDVVLGSFKDEKFCQSKLKGFVPVAHIEENPNKYLINEVITCRVLNVSVEFKMIGLTNKQRLVYSALPVITEWTQLQINMMLHVYIKSVHDKGYVVGLYNDIKGFILRDHMEEIETDLSVGDVVCARVISTEKDNLMMSTHTDSIVTSQEDREHLVDAYINVAAHRPGELTYAEVTEKLDDGVVVRIVDEESSHLYPLPKHHLSDFPSLADAKLSRLSPGTKLNVVFATSSGVSLKEDLLKYASLEEPPLKPKDLQFEQVLPGYISGFNDKEEIVTLSGGITACCSKQEIHFFRRRDVTIAAYRPFGKSVAAKVMNIEDNKKVTVSLQAKHVGFDHGDYIIKYQSALEDFIHEYVDGGFTVKIGDIVYVEKESHDKKFVVTEGKQAGFYGEFSDDAESSCGPAVAIFINYATKTIVLSRRPRVLDYAAGNSHTTIHTRSTLFCSILHCHLDVAVACLSTSSTPECDQGRLVLLPTLPHQNCIPEYSEPLLVGSDVMVHPVRGLPGGVLLCVRRSGRLRGIAKRWLRPTRVTPCLKNVASIRCGLKSRLRGLGIGEKVNFSVESVFPHCATGRIGSLDPEVKGILHASNLRAPAQHGTPAMQSIQVGQTLTCYVIGPRQTALPTPSSGSDHVSIEVGLQNDVGSLSDSIATLYDIYSVEREVTAYVQSYSKEDCQFIASVGCGICATVEDFLISSLPEEASNMESYIGRAIFCYVTEPLPALKLRAKGTIINRSSGEEEVKLGPGSVTFGRVVSHKSNLVWVDVNGGRGRVDWSDLVDSLVDRPASYFPVGQTFRCYVIETRPSLILSLKDSHTRVGSAINPDEEKHAKVEALHAGQLVQGNVIHCSEMVVYAQKGIYFSYARGLDLMCPLGYSLPGYRPIDQLRKVFYVGRLVTCKTKRVSAKPVVSCLPSETGIDLEAASPIDLTALDETPCKKRKLEVFNREEALNLIKKFRFEESVEIKTVPAATDDIKDDPGFRWDDDDDVNAIAPTSDYESDMESAEQVVMKFEKDQPQNKKSKAEAEEKEEELIRRREEELMDDSIAPQTAADWERLLASDPDDSMLWIRYMAFHIHSTEIDKAREVAEKALKTISFRKEDEKFNIWVTRLNLENLYGSDNTMQEVVRQALGANDQLKLLKHLATIYTQSGKLQKAKATHEKMVKKFRADKEVWIAYMRHLMVDHKHQDMQEVLQRCLAGVPRRHHLEVITKCGQLEFKFGDVERGRTIFENLVSTHPKRTDIWSVYIDMMCNAGRLQETREILNRVTSLKLSSKKISSFFKRFIEFEMKHGNDSTVNEVKRKALNYLDVSSR